MSDPLDRHDDDWLREELGELRDPPGPMLGPEARARADRLSRRRPALAAAALLLVGLSALLLAPRIDRELTARGARDAAISLDHLVEDHDVRRTPDRQIQPHQRVIFRVHPSRSGFVCLAEQGPGDIWTRLLPQGDAGWWLEAGRHLAETGGEVQAFRTDLGDGPRAYRALLDPDDPTCSHPIAETRLELDWLP